MYSNILLTHKIVVSLFLLQYLIKLILLLANRKEQLAKYSAATRFPEMLISLLFLITGGWMLVYGAAFRELLIIKLVCVFVAIPIAIVGFRKYNKALAVLAVLLIIAAYGLSEMNKMQKTGGKIDTSSMANDPVAAGKLIYENTCITCHGADGKLGGSGSKDLSVTMLSIDQQKEIIRKGKSAMPPYRNLTDEQVNDVIEYIGTFRH